MGMDNEGGGGWEEEKHEREVMVGVECRDVIHASEEMVYTRNVFGCWTSLV